jgi:hypothetical protein
MWAVALLIPAATLVAVGCGGGDKQDKPKTQTPAVKPGGEGKTAATGAGDKTALEVTATGTLKGKVTYDGNPPTPVDQTPLMEKQGDKSHCLKGPTKETLWLVGADKGVKNVVVWLRPPDGKFFKIPADQQNRKDVVTMDQPFCQFEPRVVALYTYFWDPESKKLKKTGQTFKVLNSAPIPHNTNFTPSNTLANTGKNEIIQPGKEMVYDPKPGRDTESGGEESINVACNIHTWMGGKVVVFDHPYFAITKDDGTYEIPNAPAGAELTVACWHESFGERLRKAAKTDKVTIEAGKATEKNLTVK